MFCVYGITYLSQKIFIKTKSLKFSIINGTTFFQRFSCFKFVQSYPLTSNDGISGIRNKHGLKGIPVSVCVRIKWKAS